MNLKLEDSENLNSLVFKSGGLREEVQLHEETISDRNYKSTIIHAILTSYIDLESVIRKNDFSPSNIFNR